MNKDFLNTYAVLLAAGEGKRMTIGDKPLVLVEGKPLSEYFLDLLNQLNIPVIIVTNPKLELKMKTLFGFEGREYAIQYLPNGNAGALIASMPILRQRENVDQILVAQADDSALYTALLLKRFRQNHEDTGATISAMVLDKPFPDFWQVSYNNQGKVERVFKGGQGIEEHIQQESGKFAAIAGCFIFNADWLLNVFDSNILKTYGLNKELILPEVIEQALSYGNGVMVYPIQYGIDWLGANTPEELRKLEQALKQRRINE